MQGTVANCAVFKTGTGAKGPWTIYKVTLQDGREPTGFDFVNVGEVVDLEEKQNGQYTNLNFKKIKNAPAAQPAQQAQPQQQYQQPAQQYQQPAPAAAPAPAPASSTDPRAVKLLVLIASQVGIDPNQISDILEGRA